MNKNKHNHCFKLILLTVFELKTLFPIFDFAFPLKDWFRRIGAKVNCKCFRKNLEIRWNFLGKVFRFKTIEF